MTRSGRRDASTLLRAGPRSISTRIDDASLPHVTRADLHCHSHASSGPAIAALGLIDAPECYSPPEKVFDQAIARGMDLVTITDHDTIAGALELVERGFQRFFIGEEVTVHFPEDRCRLHVLVWGLSPELHEQIAVLRLRDDVYHFADWLAQHNLAHSLAHPMYVQNGKLTRWHLERCVMLFKCFETLNGAHSGNHRAALERYLDHLTPARIQHLAETHNLRPLWPRVWEKGRTGGSDDHGLLNVGRAWTETAAEGRDKITNPDTFLRRIMSNRCSPGGLPGHSSLLAHQFAKVTAEYASRNLLERAGPRARFVGTRLLRFAGVDARGPSRLALAADTVLKRLHRKKRPTDPLIESLKDSLASILDKYPELRDRLDPVTWDHGPPIADHDRMAAFVDDLSDEVTRALASGAWKGLRRKDRDEILDHLASYLLLTAAQIPYIISLFHQNKERPFVERFEHETSEPGDGVSVLERSMRVSLFTDTLGDVNGVCRFIQNMAEEAMNSGRDLQVITSTRLKTPAWSNIYNFDPVFSAPMPRYEHLEMVFPPIMRILRHVDRHQPDAIHISTPGPVGMIGFIAAKMLRVPVLGVYHTDFPAYIDHLFEDQAFTWVTERFMRFFYHPFHTVFTRSEDYKRAVTSLGVAPERVRSLMPGVDTELFHPRFRDPGIWRRFPGVRDDSLKILFVGRVSVEKNMPFLASVWKGALRRFLADGIDAELIVVGDGPFRKQMEKELGARSAHFLGFRHGHELSSLYASADLFLFPSTTDTLGQVVMEAQASGIPALVSDVGGPKEVITQGITGHVIPVDEERWVDTICDLARSNENLRRMGRAAHEAMQQYSLRSSFDHFWQVHEQAWRDHLAKIGIRRDHPRGIAAARDLTSAP